MILCTTNVGALKQPLEIRRLTFRLVMLYKVINGLVAIPATSYLIPVIRVTRAHPQAYLQPQCNTNYYLYSFIPRTTVEWNRLPAEVIAAPSLEVFKSSLQNIDLGTIKYI